MKRYLKKGSFNISPRLGGRAMRMSWLLPLMAFVFSVLALIGSSEIVTSVSERVAEVNLVSMEFTCIEKKVLIGGYIPVIVKETCHP